MSVTGYVYVLALENQCWYVGYSAAENVQCRVASHFLSGGALWTRLHKPIQVVSVQPGCTLLENLICISLMCKHGFEKVRGGSYCQLEMLAAPNCITKAAHFANLKSGKCIEGEAKRVDTPLDPLE